MYINNAEATPEANGIPTLRQHMLITLETVYISLYIFLDTIIHLRNALHSFDANF